MNRVTRQILKETLVRLRQDREADLAQRANLTTRMRVIDANIEQTEMAIADVEADLAR